MTPLIRLFVLSLIGLSCNIEAFAQDLANYQKEAAESHPGLKAKYHAFEAALQKIPQVKALPEPTLSFGYFISPVETRVGPQQARLGIKQMFPWFGTLDAKEEMWANIAKAEYQSFLDARNKLYYEVASAYFPVYVLHQHIRLEDENKQILKTYRNIVQTKYETGKGNYADVLRADMKLSDTQINTATLKNKMNPLLARFNHLLDRDTQEKVNIPDTMQLVTIPAAINIDSALYRNHALRSLEHRIEEKSAAQVTASKARFPDIGLGVDYIFTGQANHADLANSGKDAFMPNITVTIPIALKKYKSSIQQAELEKARHENQKKDMLNRLVVELEEIHFELQRQKDLAHHYHQQAETAKQAVDLLLEVYSHGSGTFEEVLVMHEKWLGYQRQHIAALADFHIKLAKLQYLMNQE